MADVSDPGVSAEQAARQARRLGFWARVVLVPVAAIGAVLSFRSLYQAAVPTFGDYLAFGFPLLVDLLILGASLQYVAGAKIGRPMAGWRLTAHAGVGGTLILNALAAKELGEVPWHITAPAVWAVLVELTAKQVLGEWKATHTAKADAISLPLWMTAPIESMRTRLLMLRTGVVNAHQARIAVGVNAAAREALRLALPKRSARRVRKIINRQLRAGSLTPVAILRPLGWTQGGTVLNNARPDVILQAVLQEILDPGSTPAPIDRSAAEEARPGSTVPPIGRPRPEQFPAEPDGEADPEHDSLVRPGVFGRPGGQASPVAATTRLAQPTSPVAGPVPQFASAQFAPTQPHPAAQYPTPQYPAAPQQPAAPHQPAAQYPAAHPFQPAQQLQTAHPFPAGQQHQPSQNGQPGQVSQPGSAGHGGQPYPMAPPPEVAPQYEAAAYEQIRPFESAGHYQATQQYEAAPQYEASPAQAPGTTQPVLRPGTVQQPERALSLGRAMNRTRVLQQSGSTDSLSSTAEQLRTELVRTQTGSLPRIDRPAPDAPDRRADSVAYDDVEILDDMEHLDELDGQGYPDDFDGIDLDNAQTGSIPLGHDRDSTEAIRQRLAEARPS